ncbi:TPA: LysR family transcriptional regulator, partial [Burkholderia territorii]|nr:LysR family transcriptional regulator [Burkholderia territorii]HDR8892545.1 LysR family transcriptional regulator [Burkholderia territorii]HDR8904940.1 LysR family transcriptional regulator [Burkholderia territorii]
MEPPTDPASTALDITLLRTFLEVVDRHGFAPAAERLALTPSAVSGHIKRLEQAAGTLLLSRTTRRVALTPAGDTLYAYARNIVDMEREVRARLRGAPAHRPLRVGASEDFAGTWLPQVLRTFRDSHPRTSIELKVGITASLLREQALGRLDVVFGKQCRLVDTPGEPLWEEPLVWAFAADTALDADGGVPLALFPEPCVYREAAVAALAAALRPFRVLFESGSMAGCVSAALAGFAVTALARSQLRDGLRECGVQDGLPTLPAARFYAFASKP